MLGKNFRDTLFKPSPNPARRDLRELVRFYDLEYPSESEKFSLDDRAYLAQAKFYRWLPPRNARTTQSLGRRSCLYPRARTANVRTPQWEAYVAQREGRAADGVALGLGEIRTHQNFKDNAAIGRVLDDLVRRAEELDKLGRAIPYEEKPARVTYKESTSSRKNTSFFFANLSPTVRLSPSASRQNKKKWGVLKEIFSRLQSGLLPIWRMSQKTGPSSETKSRWDQARGGESSKADFAALAKKRPGQPVLGSGVRSKKPRQKLRSL